MASKQPKAPISAHPLFPAVVAVWFAALFGLGSGVLPNILFEKIVTVTGISTLIPAAAPPLGATARILFSLSAAIAGAALGFVLARKVAATGGERTPSPMATLTPRPDPVPPMVETKRRPISVEDLGDTKLDPYTEEPADPVPPVQFGTRRRSLALAEEERPSDFLQVAPLPGHEPQWTQQGLVPPPAPELPELPEEPLELESFAEPTLESLRRQGPQAEQSSVTLPETPAFAGDQEPQRASGFTDPRVEPASISDRGLSGLRNPSPFAAPTAAPAVQEPVATEGASEDPMQHEPAPFVPSAPATAPAYEPERAPAPVFAAAAEIEKPVLPADPAVDLETLGMVQLAERLGASLQKRLGRPKAPPLFVDGLKADLGIETAPRVAEEAIEPGSAIFGQPSFDPVAPDAPPPPPVIPAALRPLDPFAEDEDEDHIPSLSLPLGQFAPPAVEVEAEEEDEPAEELEEENYSSLLEMKHPFRTPAEFVRVEEPEPEEDAIEPAVVFPGAEPAAPVAAVTDINARPFDAPAKHAAARGRPNPEETERALRSALATLQRMGGA